MTSNTYFVVVVFALIFVLIYLEVPICVIILLGSYPLHLNPGIQNALIAQLKAALQFLDHKPVIKVGACAELNGFIQHVQGIARTGQITLSNALQLMNSGEAIQTALDC
jgi:hypothetical protein